MSAALMITMSVTAYSADQYVQVTGDNVNIRFSPSTSSQVIASARKGDIFELEGEEQEWFAISLFSGEYRYIHKSLAIEVPYEPEVPGSVSVRQQMYKAFWDLEGTAMADADRRYPPTIDVMKNIRKHCPDPTTMVNLGGGLIMINFTQKTVDQHNEHGDCTNFTIPGDDCPNHCLCPIDIGDPGTISGP